MFSRIRPTYGFVALGLVCTSLALQHLLFEGEHLGTAIESFIIASLALVVFITADELPDREVSIAGRWQALKLTVGIAAAFALLALAVWLTWLIEGTNYKLSFLLSFAATLGAAVGSRASLYAVEAEERLAEARELTKLLSINQRVLRHNIRNELSIALGYLDTIETSDDPERIDRSARIIRSHLESLIDTTERTRRLVSIWETDSLREFDLTAVVARQVARLEERNPGISVSTSLPAECRLSAHPELPLAIEEALENAVVHNPPGVEVAVSVRPRDENVGVEITDSGVGIPENERKTIERSRETPLEHTQGVGLWIIYWIVTMSGGRVEFLENEPRGTIVRMTLPTDQRETTIRTG